MDIKEAIAFGQYSGHESPQRILADKVIELEREIARLRKCMQYLIDSGYTAGTGGQTPDELCDDLLPYISA